MTCACENVGPEIPSRTPNVATAIADEAILDIPSLPIVSIKVLDNAPQALDAHIAPVDTLAYRFASSHGPSTFGGTQPVVAPHSKLSPAASKQT
jgi:hypothetical protein